VECLIIRRFSLNQFQRPSQLGVDEEDSKYATRNLPSFPAYAAVIRAKEAELLPVMVFDNDPTM
jgi:hypothetical protein